MKKREFLRAGLQCAALAAVPLGRAQAAEETSTPRRRIPIGFLGAAYSHAPPKLALVMASPDWELVGVTDSSAEGRATCAKLGANLISQEELLQRAQVIAVESPVRDHASHTMLALRAGKHVHLEKPPATGLAEMREIVALARDRKLLLQTGFMWRYHPGFQAIFESVRQGWLGEIFMVRGFIGTQLPAALRIEWGEYHGGSMFELGSHLIDATVRLLGRPEKVTAFLRCDAPAKDTLHDNNTAVLEYERAIAVLCNTALQAGATPRRAFEVLGTKGTATLQPIEPPGLEIDLAVAAGPYKKGPQQIALPPYQRYVADFAELAAAVRGERALSVSLEEELLVAETVLRVSDMP